MGADLHRTGAAVLGLMALAGCNAMFGFEEGQPYPDSGAAGQDASAGNGGAAGEGGNAGEAGTSQGGSAGDASVEQDAAVDVAPEAGPVDSPGDPAVEDVVAESEAAAGECTPGTKRCFGETVQFCTPGSTWENDEVCKDQACVDAKCVGECKPWTFQCVGQTLRECKADGYWDDLKVCTQQACVIDKCQGVCEPGTRICGDAQMLQTCDSSGAWQATACETWEVCDGSDCVNACHPGSRRCIGNTLETCNNNKLWETGTTCAGSTPFCIGGECVSSGANPPSCIGLATTCGNGTENCCASKTVPAGTFNRANDSSAPAGVSEFRLDVYEVSVGRFRKFKDAYTQSMTPEGAGKNPNDPTDGGWNKVWDGQLPPTKTEFDSWLDCYGEFETWTPEVGANESKPINCISWVWAQAFCIWDGGRLPTEAEWNYAAAGGNEQRLYPWGPNEPANDTNLAIWGCFHNGTGSCSTSANIAPVGSVSAGKGKWGHADLAGNVGEHVADFLSSSWLVPCQDCAIHSPPDAGIDDGIVRGGTYETFLPEHLTTTWRQPIQRAGRYWHTGARCARN